MLNWFAERVAAKMLQEKRGAQKAEQPHLHRIAELEQAQQEPARAVPYGWHVTGMSCLMIGEYAEHDAKAEAKRCGGTTKAISLYTHPSPLDSDTKRMVLALIRQLDTFAVETYLSDYGKELAATLKEQLEAGE